MVRDEYYVQVKEVSDGATVRLVIDLGFRTYIEQSIRLLNVVAPQFASPLRKGDPKAPISKQYVVDWLERHSRECNPTGRTWPLRLHSFSSDSFGRYMGRIYCLSGHLLNEEVVASGHATKFFKG